ncbi:MAG: antibiotic biosynthesis monooxygenase family protein [Candidatus Fervidibacter sp.]|uniref:antibiotic biosynthesis monooxygenase family protein n=1 Tax=Candidatus Fervidibacter sp. TaxID=3100871 RepID=UPI00404B170E
MNWHKIAALLLGLVVPFAMWAQGKQESQNKPQSRPAQPNFVAMFKLKVEKGYEQEFVKRFQERAGLIDKFEGFLGLFVLQHREESDSFIVMTLWRDESDFHKWVNSEEFKRAHARGGVPTKETKLDTYTVKLTVLK